MCCCGWWFLCLSTSRSQRPSCFELSWYSHLCNSFTSSRSTHHSAQNVWDALLAHHGPSFLPTTSSNPNLVCNKLWTGTLSLLRHTYIYLGSTSSDIWPSARALSNEQTHQCTHTHKQLLFLLISLHITIIVLSLLSNNTARHMCPSLCNTWVKREREGGGKTNFSHFLSCYLYFCVFVLFIE